ncbi:MAG TPA: alpha-glucosidase [Treponemataceae bacterium]|nr:alpha-glucosidase [Treponemataceae bacterium]
MTQKGNAWWKDKAVYQIYPRSFCDSNGDGIGDIPGITSKLDYLKDLGIGIMWLSPVYCSPNDDNGYDISNYRDIQKEFGTLKDMKKLISEAKKRDIRIIMDLVINHTSDEHPWFTESRKSTGNPYRDYYIWRKGKRNHKHSSDALQNQKPPNNWSSFFTGPAWHYDTLTDEFYLHLFSRKQPDLNYNNPKVLAEIKEILKFWLDLGISGFRCDVINVIYKSSLKDGKKRLALTGREHYVSQDGCHTILKELKRDVFSAYDCFTVGETVLVDTAMAHDLCSSERGELDMVFSFEHMDTDHINNKWFKTKFKPGKFIKVITKWQSCLDWNANYLENHDQIRSVSRFGNDTKYHDVSAKMLAVLLLTLRGTPFIYQGEEIGMTNAYFSDLSEIKDVESHYVNELAKKMHFPPSIRWKMIQKSSRDNARTPMQWNTQEHAGFSPKGKSDPWIRVNSNFRTINVENQSKNKDSILSFYKCLLSLRSGKKSILKGSFFALPGPKDVFCYEREFEDERCIILINFSQKTKKLTNVIQSHIKNGTILCSNYNHTDISCFVTLNPYEAVIIETSQGDKS